MKLDICVKKLFQTRETLVKGTSKNDFRDLLNLAIKESSFTFNNKFYNQVDGVAVGSPLAPILAIIFLSYHEENWLNKCPIEFKPSFYRRYVDDIFVLFESHESAHSSCEYISCKQQNINITAEQENIGSLLFLDVKICRKNGKFVTSLYRKLLHRTFSICCDFKTFHFEIDDLNFIDSCIMSSLSIKYSCINRLYTPKVINQNVPKRNVFVKLLLLGSTSFQIEKMLQNLFNDKLTSCNLKMVFTSPVRAKSFFTFKDKLPKILHFQDLFTSISVMAAMLRIMVRRNAILKSEFVSI